MDLLELKINRDDADILLKMLHESVLYKFNTAYIDFIYNDDVVFYIDFTVPSCLFVSENNTYEDNIILHYVNAFGFNFESVFYFVAFTKSDGCDETITMDECIALLHDK